MQMSDADWSEHERQARQERDFNFDRMYDISMAKVMVFSVMQNIRTKIENSDSFGEREFDFLNAFLDEVILFSKKVSQLEKEYRDEVL